MDKPNPRAGSSSAQDNNSRIVRHVTPVAQMRETSQHSPVAQRRADPSCGETDSSTYLKTRVTPLSLTARVAFAPPSLWWLCVSDCHALYVLALHGDVPRLAVRLHASFSEESLHHDLAALVPWPSAVLVRTCALTRFERVLRGRTIVSLATRCSV